MFSGCGHWLVLEFFKEKRETEGGSARSAECPSHEACRGALRAGADPWDGILCVPGSLCSVVSSPYKSFRTEPSNAICTRSTNAIWVEKAVANPKSVKWLNNLERKYKSNRRAFNSHF